MHRRGRAAWDRLSVQRRGRRHRPHDWPASGGLDMEPADESTHKGRHYRHSGHRLHCERCSDHPDSVPAPLQGRGILVYAPIC